jgi:hypothetical protein
LFCHPPYTLTLAHAAKLPLQETAPEIGAVIGGVNVIKLLFPQKINKPREHKKW